MNRTEFVYWLSGVQGAVGLSPVAKADLVLAEARRQLDVPRAPAEPPGLTSMRVGDFCAHNRNVKEHCDACALIGAGDGVRVFAVYLPVQVKQVFVSKGDVAKQEVADVGVSDTGDDRGAGDSGAARDSAP
jgi:hypothetical protein